MGKPNKQPRQKGNLKPASSSRASEHPGANTTLGAVDLGGFAQFAGPSVAGIAMPAQLSSPVADSDSPAYATNLDSELLVILKKVSKRDSITKLKALEELETYLKANTDAIPSIVSTWARMYIKLTIEVDRRVRLATNNVHYLVATKAKKKLAPHLKEFVGAWILTFFDQSPDVARSARGTFEAVFAEDKRQGVLKVYQKDILDYVMEILLYKSPETLSDPRHVSKEEMAAKFGRVIASCLYTLSYLIENLPVEEVEKYAEDYNGLLDNPTLWKFVSHESPVIRRAIYNFLTFLLLKWKDTLDARLDIVCPSFFTSFLKEKEHSTFTDMWDALLLLTKKYPDSWLVAGKKKPVMPKFYNFLRGGLNGAVNVGYPSILILLANYPQNIRDAPKFYKDFFTSFWDATSNDNIGRSTSTIFVNAYAECIVYASINLNTGDKEADSAKNAYLIETAFGDLIKAYLSGSLGDKFGPDIADVVAKHFITLASVQSVNEYTVPLLSQTEHYLIQTVVDCAQPSGRAIDMDTFTRNAAALLKSIHTNLSPVSAEGQKHALLHSKYEGWSKRLISAALASSLVFKDKSASLLQMSNELLDVYWFSFRESGSDMKEIINHAKLLLPFLDESPKAFLQPFITVYMSLVIRLEDTNSSNELWSLLLGKLIQVNDSGRQADVLILLLDQIKKASSATKGYSDKNLDVIFTTCVVDQLSAESPSVDRQKLERLTSMGLQVHFANVLISDEVMDKLVAKFQSVFEELDQYQFAAASSGAPSLALLHSALCILNVLQSLSPKQLQEFVKIPAASNIPVGVFEVIFAKVSPGENPEHTAIAESVPEAASKVWESLVSSGALDQAPVLDGVLARVKNDIRDIKHYSSPSDSVQRMKALLLSVHTDKQKVISEILGDRSYWRNQRAPFSQYSFNFLAVSIIDKYATLVDTPLVDRDEVIPVAYDMYGLSSYARELLFVAEYILNAGVAEFFGTPAEGSDKDWILQQLLVASVECQWGLAVPGSYRIWDNAVPASSLGVQAFVQHTEMILHQRLDALVRQTDTGVDWSDALYDYLTQNKATDEPLVRFIGETIRSGHFEDKEVTPASAAAARVLEMLLKKTMLFLGYSSVNLQRWFPVLKAEVTTVQPACKVAILNAFKDAFGEVAQYRNLQSDLTSKLSGVGGFVDFGEDEKKAWNLVVLLNASSLTFGAISIPPQRLTHLLLAVRKWFDDDSVIHDFIPSHRTRVLVQLAHLFMNLAESVQKVSGGQWTFFLERSFEWITYSDPTLDEELPIIYYALELFSTLKKLSKEGIDDLDHALGEQQGGFYETLLRLFAKEEGSQKARIEYQNLLSDLLEDIPQKILIEAEYIPEIFGLLFASNEAVQKRAHKLLKVYTSHIVQATSVRLEFTLTADQNEPATASIQANLLRSLLKPPVISKWHSAPLDEQPLHEVSGYLFSWLVMFEHFIDITFRLKQDYTSQLKENEAVAVLLPFLSTLLGVGVARETRPFDLTIWDIESYEADGFDSTAEISYQLLAAHLFYRSLKYIPSLVRQWWVDCKNRQLTIGVESYVEKNFSAMLIENELSLVNRPDIKSMLEDNDNNNEFSVKALKTANEVTATYTVDEQNMQIAIRLPSNFPLRQIDVEGVQKVGVNDKQWRGWMFSVAAVIGSQNGNIVDALTVFKRNLNLHFSGVEDCTICYSIISAQDRTIPTKQCRTCKHKFHASCLYKWFRSSNSASCPLCRTVF